MTLCKMIHTPLRGKEQLKHYCKFNMKHYLADLAVGTDETGPEFPQIWKMDKEQEFNSPNSVYRLSDSGNEFPNEDIDLKFLLLHPNAHLTDIISTSILPSSTGLLISSRLKDIINPPQSPLKGTLHDRDLLQSPLWETLRREKKIWQRTD